MNNDILHRLLYIPLARKDEAVSGGGNAVRAVRTLAWQNQESMEPGATVQETTVQETTAQETDGQNTGEVPVWAEPRTYINTSVTPVDTPVTPLDTPVTPADLLKEVGDLLNEIDNEKVDKQNANRKAIHVEEIREEEIREVNKFLKEDEREEQEEEKKIREGYFQKRKETLRALGGLEGMTEENSTILSDHHILKYLDFKKVYGVGGARNQYMENVETFLKTSEFYVEVNDRRINNYAAEQ